jgi:hypothetical protein
MNTCPTTSSAAGDLSNFDWSVAVRCPVAGTVDTASMRLQSCAWSTVLSVEGTGLRGKPAPPAAPSEYPANKKYLSKICPGNGWWAPHIPGFPVERAWVYELPAAFLNESRIPGTGCAAYRKSGYLARFSRDVGCHERRSESSETSQGTSSGAACTARTTRGRGPAHRGDAAES